MKVIKFTQEKKEMAISELAIIMECAKRAGIGHAVFMGFGVSLGNIMLYDEEKGYGDFIDDDDDMDICIDADKITPDQEVAYYNELDKAGMFNDRRKISFRGSDDGFSRGLLAQRPVEEGPKVRFSWFSLRPKHGMVKCCNWFMFRYGGYLWHSKGGKWVTHRKFDEKKFGYEFDDEALMKGIPEKYINELAEVDFHGVKIKFPYYLGTCVDFWYPGWWLPKQGGASKKQVVCVVKDWLKKKTWKITKA